MFEALLNNLSLRRSSAGIYYELRTLRQMLEIVFEREGLELPSARRQRAGTGVDKGDEEVEETLYINPLDEERLARIEADRISRDRLSGRDPGTSWQEDVNR